MSNTQSVEETRSERGFTLIELMIVVIVIAVLASLAVAGYGAIIEDARRSEAEAFLAVVRGKQELYNSRFGRFLNASANPATVPNVGQKVPWRDNDPGWLSLGANPSGGLVAWQYSTGGGSGACVAGAGPSSPPADVAGACGGLDSGVWFWAIARNEDVIMVTNSARNHIWVIE